MGKKIKKKRKRSLKEIQLKEFKKAVWEEGFSLEHDVFKTLQENGWEILPNRHFQESPNENVREYDLCAIKGYSFKLEGEILNFYIVLIIECKYNPFKIVFYVRPLNESYPLTSFVGKKFLKIFPQGEKEIQEIFKGIKRYKNFFILNEQVFGYQTFEYNKNAINKQNELVGGEKLYKPRNEWTEKTVFKAINSVSAATRFEKTLHKKEWVAEDRLCLFFPLVIFSDNLFRAFMTKKKKKIKKHPFFIYKMGGKSIETTIIPEEYCLHIINKSQIKTLIKIFENLFRELKNVINTKIINRSQNLTPKSDK